MGPGRTGARRWWPQLREKRLMERGWGPDGASRWLDILLATLQEIGFSHSYVHIEDVRFQYEPNHFCAMISTLASRPKEKIGQTGDFHETLDFWTYPRGPGIGILHGENLPTRVHVQDVHVSGHALPSDVIYIGHSHFSHRLASNRWQCPFVPGRDGAPEQVVFKYLQTTSGLQRYLHQLRGKRLACDCLAHEFCHGDVLMAMCLHAPRQSAPIKPQARRVLLAMTAGLSVPGSVAYPIPQSSVVAAAQSLLSGYGLTDLPWPHVADLVNSPELQAYSQWLTLVAEAMTQPLDLLQASL